jgi:hypothetical protein
LAKYGYLSEMVKEEQIHFIALSETGRDDFSDTTLKNFCGGRDFIWYSMAHMVVQAASFWGLT